MKSIDHPITNVHFLGSKLRSLRKQSGMTLEDLATRCIQIDTHNAPSISYLSLIETGRRSPAKNVLKVFSKVFQKDLNWFLDDRQQPKTENIEDIERALERMQLEPGILFSKDLLEIAIPELLTQSRISGRQFAHILIRAHQEKNRNQFPDLERTADRISKKRFPLQSNHILELYAQHDLKIKWFKKNPFNTVTDRGLEVKTQFRSFFDYPNTVYINETLRYSEARLKYDLAYHLGHKILHGGDGMVSSQATGGELGGSPKPAPTESTSLNQKDILIAWRDFECSFFAGALLCPRQPFRQFLARKAYDIFSGKQVDLTPTVIMRRMTAVSPYRHWHYFDVYTPNKLRAVYRGNGIPLPWGTMTNNPDLCRQWALFRLADHPTNQKTLTQISLMKEVNRPSRLYACIATRLRDAAGNPHVISVGVDLLPLLKTHGSDIKKMIKKLENITLDQNHRIEIPDTIKSAIQSAGSILNIGWINTALESPANIICPRCSACPLDEQCSYSNPKSQKQLSWIEEIKSEIISEK